MHGLVIQAYDPVTSYTAKLHLGAREIIKLIEFQEDRMTDPELIQATVSRYILKRLDRRGVARRRVAVDDR